MLCRAGGLISPDIQSWAILAPLPSHTALRPPIIFSRNPEMSQIVLIYHIFIPGYIPGKGKITQRA